MSKSKENKKKKVEFTKKLIEEYPVIGIADVTNLPALQLQNIRFKLKPDIITTMIKKRLVKIAMENSEKQNIKELENHLKGIPLLIFSKQDSFKLSKRLRKNRSNAPAKPGQIAPDDIIVPAGATEFTPGPIIGELGKLGLKTSVEGGKIAIQEDKVVVKAGEEIKEDVAGVLSKLGIEPMKIGLNLIATYDNGTIFTRDVLSIDDEKYIGDLNTAISQAFNLTINITYPTKENIKLLISKGSVEAETLNSRLDIKEVSETKEIFEEKKHEVTEKAEVKEEPKEEVQEKIEETKNESPEENKETEKKEEQKPEPNQESDENKKIEENTKKAQDVLKQLQDEKLKEPLKIGQKDDKPIKKGPKPEDLIGS